MTLTNSYQKIAEQYLGYSYGSLYVRIYAKVNSQDENNLTSEVSYQSRLYYNGNSYIIAQGQTKVVTSGTGATTATTSWQNFEGGGSGYYYSGETVVKTITGTVTHDEDGTASITTSAVFTSAGSWGWEGTASGSANLPVIETSTLRLGVNGSWKKATPYLAVNGQWVKCKAYTRVNNSWKKGV